MTKGDSCEEENNNLYGCFSCHYTRVLMLRLLNQEKKNKWH